MKYLLIILLVFLYSCATIINKKTYPLKVTSDNPGSTVRYKDSTYVLPAFIRVERSKKPLILSGAFNNSHKKFYVPAIPTKSFLFGNLAFNDLTMFGYIIDFTNPKRFYYGKEIKLTFNDTIQIIKPKTKNCYYKWFHDAFYKVDSLDYKNCVKITPFRPIYVDNPGLEIGFERFHTHKISSEISFRYLTNLSRNYLFQFNDLKGFGITFEEKYFLKKSKVLNVYLSNDISFNKMKFTDYDEFGYSPYRDSLLARTYNYYDTFQVRKQTISYNFRIGLQINIDRVIIDITTGIGIKYRDVAHYGRKNPGDEMVPPFEPNYFYDATVEGKYNTLNIPMTLRVGYRF